MTEDFSTEPFRIERIDHVQLAMPPGSEDQAVAFYQGLLNIPQVPKPPELAARGGCWFERDGLCIHLGAEDGFRPAKKAHPALVVRGIEALSGLLAQQGELVVDRDLRPGHVRDVHHDRVHRDGPHLRGSKATDKDMAPVREAALVAVSVADRQRRDQAATRRHE